jgi:hypothetical protein
MITDKRAKALAIIENNRIDMPSSFARLMWPGNPAWKRPSKAGPNGSAHGGGMRLAGGAFLGKLIKAELVRRSGLSNIYYLTIDGENSLAEYRTSQKVSK